MQSLKAFSGAILLALHAAGAQAAEINQHTIGLERALKTVEDEIGEKVREGVKAALADLGVPTKADVDVAIVAHLEGLGLSDRADASRLQAEIDEIRGELSGLPDVPLDADQALQDAGGSTAGEQQAPAPGTDEHLDEDPANGTGAATNGDQAFAGVPADGGVAPDGVTIVTAEGVPTGGVVQPGADGSVPTLPTIELADHVVDDVAEVAEGHGVSSADGVTLLDADGRPVPDVGGPEPLVVTPAVAAQLPVIEPAPTA